MNSTYVNHNPDGICLTLNFIKFHDLEYKIVQVDNVLSFRKQYIDRDLSTMKFHAMIDTF